MTRSYRYVSTDPSFVSDRSTRRSDEAPTAARFFFTRLTEHLSSPEFGKKIFPMCVQIGRWNKLKRVEKREI